MTATRSDDVENRHGVTVWVNGPLKGEGVVEDDKTITPGAAVKQGTGAGEVDQAGAGDEAEAQGWCTENTIVSERTLDTDLDQRGDFEAGERVVYGRNVGDRFMAPCAGLSGDTTYDKTTYLKLHADGYQPAEDGDTAVARILVDDDVEVADGEVEYILAEWLGPRVIVNTEGGV